VQIAVFVYGLLWLAVKEPPFQWFASFFDVPLLAPAWLGQVFFWLAVLTTVWSGIRATCGATAISCTRHNFTPNRQFRPPPL
jgi:hypothetical protein